MTIRTLSIAAVAAASIATPMIGVAASAPLALDNCVKAFMTTLANKSPGAFKLRDAHYTGDAGSQNNLLVLGGVSEMTLTARDAHDSHAVARAVCAVNSAGQVVDLHSEPLAYITQ